MLAHDRHHRLVVQLGVVQTVQQVDRPRARGGHAASRLAGELGVRARHERRHLLVPRLDELRIPLRPAERPEHHVFFGVDVLTELLGHHVDRRHFLGRPPEGVGMLAQRADAELAIRRGVGGTERSDHGHDKSSDRDSSPDYS